jgi:glycosyltransferase involved in cell wall biosynthesis
MLYVGNNRHHKNLEGLIRAFALGKNRLQGWHLVLCGVVDHRYDDPTKWISEEGLDSSVTHLGLVDDDKLDYLYSGASFVIVPSLYEGFGLPALEAAIRGKAVLASDIDALREVMAEAALYCDPLNPKSISDGMIVLANDRAMRSRLEIEGCQRAKGFNCKRFGEETISALEKNW